MCSSTKGNKIRSGYLTFAFSEAQKRVEMLHHPCILGDPQNQGGQNQKRVPHPYFLGSPKKGTSPFQKRAEMLCHPCLRAPC